MAGNKSLHAANKAKKDEFYTQLGDIENELRHYRNHFRDKTVFCNCDDPYESNFFKYFAMNFNQLGLKKLIATCYDGSPVANNQLSLFDNTNQTRTGVPHKIVITEVSDTNGDGAINLADVEWLIKHDKHVLSRLNGNGDFRTPASIELLKEADIVVTNPPFSLFREYVAQLIKYDKKFLIIGSVNAITYKECFQLIKSNKLWLGYGFNAGNAFFKVSEPSYYAPGVYNSQTGLVKFRNCTWFTNLDHSKRHEDLDLYKHYTPEEFPQYDNYDAINVNKTADIPCDYDGVMGVPITFLDKYNPEQFELIGAMTTTKIDGDNFGYPYVNGKKIYARILIRKIKK